MAELTVTKPRITLLDAIAADQVWWCYEDGESYWDTADWQRKVTARVEPMEQAGWIVVQPAGSRWLLTAQGHDIVNANRGAL